MLVLVLLIAAVLLFAAGAVPMPTSRFSLVSAGLFCLTLAILLTNTHLVTA